MKHFFHRRTVLGLLISSALAACKTHTPLAKQPKTHRRTGVDANEKPTSLAETIYQHGVASGDPDSNSVVIWTRITTKNEALVDWEVSDSSDFTIITAHGQLTTDSNKDFTVKAIPGGLTPGKTYYYLLSNTVSRWRRAQILLSVTSMLTMPSPTTLMLTLCCTQATISMSMALMVGARTQLKNLAEYTNRPMRLSRWLTTGNDTHNIKRTKAARRCTPCTPWFAVGMITRAPITLGWEVLKTISQTPKAVGS